MKKLLCLFAVIPMLALSGCDTMNQMAMDNAVKAAKPEDFGPPPPTNHFDFEKPIILSTLKDPDSAEFKSQDGKPMQQAIPVEEFSYTPLLVWVTSFQMNAKNSYGGYVGYEFYFVAWRDNKIIAHMDADSGWIYLNPPMDFSGLIHSK